MKKLRATSIIFKPKVHLNSFSACFPYFENIEGPLCDNLAVCAVPPNFARQRFGKHIPLAKNTHITVK
jgi:hypothetical protein